MRRCNARHGAVVEILEVNVRDVNYQDQLTNTNDVGMLVIMKSGRGVVTA